MANVTGTIGDQQVDLTNAATEQTLAKMYEAVLRQNMHILSNQKALNQIAVNTGKAAANAKEPSLADIANPVAEAAGKLGVLAKGAMILGGVIADLAGGVSKTIGNLINFGSELMEGTGKASGLFAAFKDLPLGLGLLAGLFEKIAKIQEENLDTYRTLSKSGLNFGGELINMRNEIAATYQTVEQFNQTIAKNSDLFTSMGGNAEDGGRAFVNINKALVKSGKGLGADLLGLGFSFQELNQLTGDYIRSRGGLTKEEAENTDLMTEKVVKYGKEMDRITQLTGMNREQQEKIMEEELNEANFRAYMATLSTEDQEALSTSIKRNSALYGKAGADIVKSAALGIGPMTDAGKMLYATSKESADAIGKDAQLRKKYGDQSIQVTQNEAQGRIAAQKNLGQFTGIVGVASGMFKDLAPVIQQNTNEQKAGIRTQQAYEDNIARINKNAQTRAESEAAAAASVEKSLKDLGNGLRVAFAPALAKLTPEINKIAMSFGEFAAKHMDQFTKVITRAAEYIKNLFTEDGRRQIVSDLKSLFEELGEMLFDAINPFGETKTERKTRQAVEESDEYKNWMKQMLTNGNYFQKQLIQEGNKKDIFAMWASQNPTASRAATERQESLRREEVMNPNRHSGSFGETGSAFENFGRGTWIKGHGVDNEGMFTKDDINKLLASSGSQAAASTEKSIEETIKTAFAGISGSGGEETKILLSEVKALNNNIKTLTMYAKESADYDRRNLDAVRGISGNVIG